MKVSLPVIMGFLGYALDAIAILAPELRRHRDGRRLLKKVRKIRRLVEDLTEYAIEQYENAIIEKERAAHAAREAAIALGETDQKKLAGL